MNRFKFRRCVHCGSKLKKNFDYFIEETVWDCPQSKYSMIFISDMRGISDDNDFDYFIRLNHSKNGFDLEGSFIKIVDNTIFVPYYDSDYFVNYKKIDLKINFDINYDADIFKLKKIIEDLLIFL